MVNPTRWKVAEAGDEVVMRCEGDRIYHSEAVLPGKSTALAKSTTLHTDEPAARVAVV
jgi:hypothetical protein